MRLPVICEKTGLNKGTWTSEEDELLSTYIWRYGHGNWGKLPKHAGLNRTGKSCRLRWLNYLRPDLKKGSFTPEEEELIHNLHQQFGNSWCRIAARLPGRSDNEIKNYWHTSRKNRSAANKATQKPKSFLQEDRDLVDLETSCFGLMRPQKSCDLSNEVVVKKVSIADERKPEYDAAAWPDLVELESMLETITSLEKYDGENYFECDHPDDNITTVLDFPFPVTPPRSEGFFSPFVLNNTNQPTKDAVKFAEPDSESDGHFWNEMLLMSQNLDMAFVLAEAWLLPPSQPEYDAAAWPDLVELESMLETITSLEKYDGENNFECDHPDDNITTVLDFPFPATPPRSEGFFSPFVLNNTNQPTEDAVIFAEPDLESDGHFWNEMLLMSQNLDMAFVLAEAWLLPPSQPPEEALHEYPYYFYNGYHG